MDVLLRVTNAIDHDLYCQMGIAKYVEYLYAMTSNTIWISWLI